MAMVGLMDHLTVVFVLVGLMVETVGMVANLFMVVAVVAVAMVQEVQPALVQMV
jgi:hypothetical protein